MAIEYDAVKDGRNVRERGISLAQYADLEVSSALIWEDRRRDYGEVRLLVLGMLGGRLHAAVISPRGANTRVISLRRANARERRAYAEKADPARR